jgi:PhnB protein
VREPRQEQCTWISVMLIVPDAGTAVAWYEDALGATELWNLAGVAGQEVDGAPFSLHEINPKNPSATRPDRLAVTSTRIELFVDDQTASWSGQSPRAQGWALNSKTTSSLWRTHRQGVSEIRSDLSGPSVTGHHSAAGRTERPPSPASIRQGVSGLCPRSCPPRPRHRQEAPR